MDLTAKSCLVRMLAVGDRTFLLSVSLESWAMWGRAVGVCSGWKEANS